MRARRMVELLVLVIAAAAGLVACSVTIESGEVSAFHHRPAAEESDTPTPWPTPTPTVKG